MATVNNQDSRITTIENSIGKTFLFNKNLTVTAGQWTDTGVLLDTGTYLLKIYVHSAGSGGTQWYETYSGICSMYKGDINSSNITEIPLTNAGHASNGKFTVLGFKRVVRANAGQQCLVISANESFTNCPVEFHLRKVM